jgi:hypothetical protein
MKVLIGVDAHKVSVVLAVLDEASGELLERAPPTSFGGPARRPYAGSKDRGAKRAHRSRGRGFRHHPYRNLRHGSHTPGREDHRYGVGNVVRFQTKANYFASYSGTAPVEASSGGGGAPQALLAGRKPQAQGNALHRIAICQARWDACGGSYYRKKIAEGKSRKEALRCLKRRVSDAVFRSLMADSRAPPRAAPLDKEEPRSLSRRCSVTPPSYQPGDG